MPSDLRRPAEIGPDLTIDEMMRRWPATIRHVIAKHMHCVGCPIAPFHTIAEACRAHRVRPQSFLQSIRRVAPHDSPALRTRRVDPSRFFRRDRA